MLDWKKRFCDYSGSFQLAWAVIKNFFVQIYFPGAFGNFVYGCLFPFYPNSTRHSKVVFFNKTFGIKISNSWLDFSSCNKTHFTLVLRTAPIQSHKSLPFLPSGSMKTSPNTTHVRCKSNFKVTSVLIRIPHRLCVSLFAEFVMTCENEWLVTLLPDMKNVFFAALRPSHVMCVWSTINITQSLLLI